MWTDPIVEELHEIREEHAKKFSYDVHAIFEDLKEKERQSGCKVLSLPLRRTAPPESCEDTADAPAESTPMTHRGSGQPVVAPKRLA